MRKLFMIGISFVLLGCTHEATLLNPEGQPIGNAELKFDSNNAGTMQLNRNGDIYQGQWTAVKVDESATIAKQYGMGSRKYQNYRQGKGSYLKSGQSTLKSNNGVTLNCEFKYRGTSAHGWCSSETEMFEFMVKS
jgi:hypothetical protein